MDDFSHNLLATILFKVPEQGERVSGGPLTFVTVNSRDACSRSCSEFLFCTRDFCSLPVWGILTELLPWPCPLTLLENWLEGNAGVEPAQGGFLLHYLDKLVYPDISSTMLTIAAVIICALNLAFYGRQVWIGRLR